MFRCQILINGISYEATDDLKNWMISVFHRKDQIMTGLSGLLVHNLNLSTVPTSF